MQPTDKVYVIREFIWSGNRFPASTTPYLWGEFSRVPDHIKNNKDFILPVEEVTVTAIKQPQTGVTRVNGGENTKVISNDKLEIKLEKEEAVTEKEEAVVEPEVKENISEDPAPFTPRKRKTTTKTVTPEKE